MNIEMVLLVGVSIVAVLELHYLMKASDEMEKLERMNHGLIEAGKYYQDSCRKLLEVINGTRRLHESDEEEMRRKVERN